MSIFRERYIDIEDVAERILAALDSHPAKRLPFAKDTVIAARELRPSTLVELAGSPPLAIVAEKRRLDLAHVYPRSRVETPGCDRNQRNYFRRVKNGDSVVVDGFNGRIIVNPANDTLKLFAPAKPKIETKAPATDTRIQLSKHSTERPSESSQMRIPSRPIVKHRLSAPPGSACSGLNSSLTATAVFL
jgi:phosphotransferase system enzyme I (PtsI)